MVLELRQMVEQDNLRTELIGRVATNAYHRCGKVGHLSWQCLFKNAKCHNCGKVGHIKKACRNKQDSGVVLTEATRQGKQQTKKAAVGRTVKTVEPSDTSSVEEHALHQLTEDSGCNPIELNVDIQGETISMELDTGAAVSLISGKTYNQFFSDISLKKSTVKLKSYSGEDIPVIGQMEVLVKYNHSKKKLYLY